MAGFLPKNPENFSKIPGTKVAIIASMWHAGYVDKMVERNVLELLKLDVKETDIQIHKIPGSLELPMAARILFETYPDLDAIIAYGVVLKGGTTHDATVIDTVVNGFVQVSDRFGKPIINEVIGVVDLKDAERRSSDDTWNKGLEAAFTLSEFITWKRNLKK